MVQVEPRNKSLFLLFFFQILFEQLVYFLLLKWVHVYYGHSLIFLMFVYPIRRNPEKRKSLSIPSELLKFIKYLYEVFLFEP